MTGLPFTPAFPLPWGAGGWLAVGHSFGSLRNQR